MVPPSVLGAGVVGAGAVWPPLPSGTAAARRSGLAAAVEAAATVRGTARAAEAAAGATAAATLAEPAAAVVIALLRKPRDRRGRGGRRRFGRAARGGQHEQRDERRKGGRPDATVRDPALGRCWKSGVHIDQ